MNSTLTRRKVHRLGVIIFSLLGEFVQVFMTADQSAAISTAQKNRNIVMLVLNDGVDCEVRVDGEVKDGLIIHCHGQGDTRGTTKFFLPYEGNWEFKFSNNETVQFTMQLEPTPIQLEHVKQIKAYVVLCYKLTGGAKTIGTLINVLLATPTEKIESVFRRKIKKIFEEGKQLFGRRMLTLIADSIRSEQYSSHRGIARLVDYNI